MRRLENIYLERVVVVVVHGEERIYFLRLSLIVDISEYILDRNECTIAAILS